MLMFAAPQNAWFLLLPAGILALYLLRRKYLPKQVPSTFLWKTAVRDYAANKPLQRLRKNLLLPVQFLAALVLALALMQPNLTGGAASRTVLIFDLSGSMQTVSGGKNRLEEAKDRAEEFVKGLPPGEEFTILSAGAEVRQVLAGSSDREDVRRAIRSLDCGRGGADLEKAVSLAEAIRREETDRGTRIIVLSDGYVPKAGVTALNCGRGEENRGICALAAEEGSVYARLCNFGEDCRLTVSCEADGKLCEAKEVQIPAGETQGVSFRIPDGAVKAEVRIREADALAADNRAEAPVMRSVKRTVALDTDSLFLESALKARTDLTVVRTAGDDPSGTQADLYILGENPVIFTLHPGETAFSWAEEEQEAEYALTAAEDTPLSAGLTLKNVAIRAFRPVSGGKTLLRCGTDAAAAYTDTEVIVGFDLHDTNLPLKYDFPVLIQNMLDWLLPAGEEENAGVDMLMPMAGSDVRVVAPDDEAEALSGRTEKGRELTGILLAVFLVLLLAEMGVSRYVG